MQARNIRMVVTPIARSVELRIKGNGERLIYLKIGNAIPATKPLIVSDILIVNMQDN